MVAGNKWKQRKIPEGISEERIAEIAEACGVSLLTAAVMVRRGCLTAEEGMAYLDPQYEDLHDPFLLPDMAVAVNRLIEAREKKEKVCVYGDYDADGTTATAILLKYFRHIGIDAFFRIPNRLTEGYGMNLTAMEAVIEQGANLILTVDNGISCIKEVDFCNAKGIDVIVTDHHECQEKLPAALAVINAKREDSAYPFSELCGAGIAFKLIQALDSILSGCGELDEYLECAALATVADIVPLKDENRTIVSLGLQTMNSGALNPGMQALIAVSEVEQITAGNIGYVLSPKINAAGRLGNANRILDLYLAESFDAAYKVAERLKTENEHRQEIEQEIFREALSEVETKGLWKNDFILVAGHDWHSGVIGIVASKLQERWFHPVIVVGIEDDGSAKGSCRSVPGVDIFQALSACKECFDNFGGHEQAAGFSIQEKNLPELQRRLSCWGNENQVSEHCIKTLYYDAEIKPENIETAFLEELEHIEPCGIGNPGPVFKLKISHAKNLKAVGKEKKHLSFISDGLRCVGFNLANQLPVISAGECETLCRIKGNYFKGEFSIQPNIIDIKGHPLNDNLQCWNWLKLLRQDAGFSETLKDACFWQYPLEQLVPEHKQMAVLYHCFSDDRVSSIGFDQLKENIGSINSFQVLLTLYALSELKFIEFQIRKGIVYGKKSKNPEKNSIQKAPIVVKLNLYKDMMKEGQ